MNLIGYRPLVIRELRSRFGYSMLEAAFACDAFDLMVSIDALPYDENLKNVLWRLSPRLLIEVREFIQNCLGEQGDPSRESDK